MKKPRGVFVAGNWKMNHGPTAAREFVTAVAGSLATHSGVRTAVFPPALSIPAAQDAVAGSSLEIGAQNVHQELSGAFTGEISGPFCLELGVKLALVGHSERRQYFGETNASAGARLGSLLAQGFQVIFCIGETREQRESGRTHAILEAQLAEALAAARARGQAIEGDSWKRLVLAYEPVWAIGTGLTATPEQAQDAHAFIRSWLEKHGEWAGKTPLLYGGSVTPENFAGLLACPDIDGALVGGASLKPQSFLKLIDIAAQVI